MLYLLPGCLATDLKREKDVYVLINIKLELKDKKQTTDRIVQAEESKKKAVETMEEAWTRIFGMKNSEADIKKLRAVKHYMNEGTIGRRSEDYGKRFSKAEAIRLYNEVREKTREDRIRKLVEQIPENYHLITEYPDLIKVKNMANQEPIIALDTETTGVNVYEDKLLGFSLTFPNQDFHCYIPIRREGIYEVTVMTEKLILEEMRCIIESELIKKVLHNSKFDIHILRSHGVKLKGLQWDTMVAQHVLNENEDSLALKKLATKYLGEEADTFEELFGKNAKYYEVPVGTKENPGISVLYACKDTHLTWKLYEFQQYHFNRLPDLRRIYEEVENPTIWTSIEMERTGFIIDKDKAGELQIKLESELKEIERLLLLHFGDINYGSPKQLKDKLYGELKLQKHLPPDMRRKLSTDAKALKILAKHHKGVATLLDYREKTKLLGTYIIALPQKAGKDGRVHGQFNQIGTVTGRYSSKDPNLQNQPKYARKLFIAPKGWVIMGGDFSQQEPRILAHLTGEEELVRIYLAGEDLYTSMAAKIFNKPIEICGDGSFYRKATKTIVLAILYGTSPKTVAQSLKIEVNEALKIIEDFFRKFPKVAKWIEGNKEDARVKGYVEMMFGRKRRLPGARSTDKWERLRAERQATNAIIQGSAAIQTKLTIIALQKLCRRKGWRLLATVHDEVLVLAPVTITREEVQEFEDVMINTVKLRVPNKTDIEIQTRWGEGMKPEEYFTGTVDRAAYPDDDSFEEQKKLVARTWQQELLGTTAA